MTTQCITEGATRLAPVRLFVLDDHVMVHDAIRSVVATSTGIELVGSAYRVGGALERLGQAAPQVALVDISLPDGDGVSLARRIREQHPSVRCVMFTWHEDRKALLAAMLAGADGFVVKQIDAAGILDAVLRTAEGQMRLDPVAVTALMDRCHAAARTAGYGGASRRGGPRLNPRELAILEDAVAGLTDTGIATRQQMSAETVNRYTSLIYTKLSLWSSVL